MVLVWKGFEQNRCDLGFEATRQFHLEKLKRPEMFDAERIGKDLADLETGKDQTFSSSSLRSLQIIRHSSFSPGSIEHGLVFSPVRHHRRSGQGAWKRRWALVTQSGPSIGR